MFSVWFARTKTNWAREGVGTRTATTVGIKFQSWTAWSESRKRSHDNVYYPQLHLSNNNKQVSSLKSIQCVKAWGAVHRLGREKLTVNRQRSSSSGRGHHHRVLTLAAIIINNQYNYSMGRRVMATDVYDFQEIVNIYASNKMAAMGCTLYRNTQSELSTPCLFNSSFIYSTFLY